MTVADVEAALGIPPAEPGQPAYSQTEYRYVYNYDVFHPPGRSYYLAVAAEPRLCQGDGLGVCVRLRRGDSDEADLTANVPGIAAVIAGRAVVAGRMALPVFADWLCDHAPDETPPALLAALRAG